MPNTELQEHFRNNLLELLDETFNGPAQDGSAYLDRNAGFAQTLEQLTAEQASLPAWPGATSIAAQVEHTRYYLDILLVYARGGKPDSDWQASWAKAVVSGQEWQDLRSRFFDTYATVRQALESEAELDDDFGGAMLAILTHSAYHLGAVRQLVQAQRSAGQASS